MRTELVLSTAFFASLALAACGSSAAVDRFNDGGGGTSGSGGASGSGGSEGNGGSGGSAGHRGGHDASSDAVTHGDGSGTCPNRCGGKCSDPSSDPNNCGGCGNACASYQTCTAGACTTTLSCPAPFSGAPTQAVAASMTENDARAASGIPCATLVAAIDTSAADHCAYYAANATNKMCSSDPHVEVSGCADYVAAQFYDRMAMAGYTGTPAFEDMAFSDDGASATTQWIDSIWHRIPVLSPWIRDFGYGGATGCDTMDFGVGAATPDDTTAVYPYPGQVGVPTSFNGTYEGPPPPAPPSGWPSGYPITVYIKSAMTASVHTITVLGTTTPLDHQLISPSDPSAMGLLTDELILYTNAPLSPSTSYHVHVEATGAAGATKFDWVFSTM